MIYFNFGLIVYFLLPPSAPTTAFFASPVGPALIVSSPDFANPTVLLTTLLKLFKLGFSARSIALFPRVIKPSARGFSPTYFIIFPKNPKSSKDILVFNFLTHL